MVLDFIKRKDVQMFLTLLGIIIVLFLIKDFLSIILLTTIFSYIGHVGINRIKSFTKVNQPIGTIIFYLLVLGFAVVVISLTASMLFDQLKGIPAMIEQALDNNHLLYQRINEWAAKNAHNTSFVKGGQNLAMSGLGRLGKIGIGIEHVVLAYFLSFIFNLTYRRLTDFGQAFLKSRYKLFFNNIYFLAKTFISILGKVVETQLVICTINTILMVIGLWIIGIPKLLVLAIIVFALGLVPIAGVIISLVPLSLIAFSAQGLTAMLEVWLLVLIVHLFESYFLHPRLMSGATDLPIFATFVTLITMGKLFGAWGLIVGIPIVVFFIEIFDVHMPSRHQRTVKDSIEQEIE